MLNWYNKKNWSSKKKITASTFRTNTTTYIRSLKSRQEFVPLVGKYIDKAKAEPLHIKNNVCKEMFMKVWDVVIAVVHFVCKEMMSNKLANKLRITVEKRDLIFRLDFVVKKAEIILLDFLL